MIDRVSEFAGSKFARERLQHVAGVDVSRETFAKLRRYAELLLGENERQNLISRGTLDDLWERHIVDSAQLARFGPGRGSSWVDIGAGAGLPGIVIACLVDGPVALIEPRRLRAEFLHKVAESLDLRVSVIRGRAESVVGKYDVITARAVAPLTRLFAISQHLSTGKTVWALPKGRSAEKELAEAKLAWQGTFHVERSKTDPNSYIVVATGVKARKR